MRQSIYKLVYKLNRSPISVLYSVLMVLAIILSVVPLMFREELDIFDTFETFAGIIFIFDYLAKWFTADLRSSSNNRLKAFLLYPFSPWAILDLFTIFPTFNLINRGFVAFRIARLAKIARLLRLFKESSHFAIIINVIKAEAATLVNVLALCLVYIFVTALIMFNHEESITNFLDALYWSTTALTTIGYGDICPQSDAGKIISMISSLVGIAIIALPSGVLTARYLDELAKRRSK